MPELERDVGGPEVHFHDVVDAVVLGAFVPPVPVLELEVAEGQGGEVGFDFADLAAGCVCELA